MWWGRMFTSMFRTDDGHPGWLVRLVIGMVGSAAPLAGPCIVKIVAVESNARILSEANTASLTILAVIAGAWILSVIATMFSHDRHVLSLIIGSMGIPGLVVSATVGLQALK
jgi:uncharacterized membrane protein YeaQ/YmgE (transglycosylase-associated protein family)